MITELIDLNIGGVDFTKCIVDFEYEPADPGSMVQPPYDEQVTIYQVQFEASECGGFDVTIWADLQDLHFHLIQPQVLDWIHEQQDGEI